ncbi:MAG: DUF1553 domain-containing protein [Planctomycetes bacterium]|nr:DUF1553 domain-containing protein [Planctomycetota bacterium]
MIKEGRKKIIKCFSKVFTLLLLSLVTFSLESIAHGFEKAAHWAFQPVKKVDPPADPTGWSGNPIDRFIRAKLAERGLHPVGAADRRTLLRRAYFDLIGLPPLPEEVQAFLDDDSPDAFAKVVDRLLASPHYGERWGRHWLDVARYADTAGETADFPVQEAYRYRNYVIAAFNQGKPYDQMIREQIAGDLLALKGEREKYAERVIATGYIAITRRFGYNPTVEYHVMLSDTIDTLGRSILGLAIGCARCHDHKYDPISMSDYYALYGIFDSTTYAFPGCEGSKPGDFMPMVPPAEAEVVLKAFGEELAKYDAEVSKLDAERKALEEELKSQIQPPAAPREAMAGDPAVLEARKKRVAALEAKMKALAADLVESRNRRDAFRSRGAPLERAYAVSEGKPHNARIQERGDPKKLGDEVPRRFLKILGGDLVPEGEGSGRWQLAEWLTRPTNPLTARVMVNRIWQHHFGEGMVMSPNNFGVRGSPPTHPELLDYLAALFMENGWSIKAMHRLIMLAKVYQLSSDNEPLCSRADPGNELHWRFKSQRLDAESLRDAMLAVSGELDRSMGQGHRFPPKETWNFSQHNPFKAQLEDTHRRSIYLLIQRNYRHPYLELFDGADPCASTEGRLITTTPAQALFIMNHAFVRQQAEKFAARLLAAEPDGRRRVALAYELAFARPPDGEEARDMEEYLARYRQRLEQARVPAERQLAQMWASFTHILFSSNEFIYVD